MEVNVPRVLILIRPHAHTASTALVSPELVLEPRDNPHAVGVVADRKPKSVHAMRELYDVLDQQIPGGWLLLLLSRWVVVVVVWWGRG